MEININLTAAEAKALAHIAYDPQEWAENMIKERARIAMDEIFQIEVARMLSDPSTTQIPADRDTVVLAADIKTAREISSTSQGQEEISS
jgi:hypothetical protein